MKNPPYYSFLSSAAFPEINTYVERLSSIIPKFEVFLQNKLELQIKNEEIFCWPSNYFSTEFALKSVEQPTFHRYWKAFKNFNLKSFRS